MKTALRRGAGQIASHGLSIPFVSRSLSCMARAPLSVRQIILARAIYSSASCTSVAVSLGVATLMSLFLAPQSGQSKKKPRSLTSGRVSGKSLNSPQVLHVNMSLSVWGRRHGFASEFKRGEAVGRRGNMLPCRTGVVGRDSQRLVERARCVCPIANSRVARKSARDGSAPNRHCAGVAR